MRLGKAGVNIIQINRLTLYDQSLQGEPIRPKPELKIEDCKLNICGWRFASSLFKMDPPESDLMAGFAGILCNRTIFSVVMVNNEC